MLLHHGELTPASIRNVLSPLFNRYEAAKHRSASEVSHAGAAAGDDPMSQLERLAKLRDAGALTEQEFQAARAPYVARLTRGE